MRKEEAAAAAAECYHWKDFEWEDLRREIEADPLLRYHLLAPASATASAQSAPPSDDSQPWDHFHTRHSSGKFFKERRYILKEFPELLSCDKDAKILEVGCGNGSTILPILRGNGNVNVYACDCSVEALKRAEDIIYAAGLIAAKTRFHPFLCDFSISGFPKWLACDNCRDLFSMKQDNFLSDVVDLAECSSMDGHNCCIGGVDFVTLIFTLSAVPRHRMSAAIAACFSVLKPGGMLLFRDYGLYDMTMLRFEPEKKVGFREYIRTDGTHSYFFSLDIVKDLFLRAGFTEVELEYCCVKLVNRRTGKIMRRVWIHGKFRKPSWSVPTCAPAHPTLLEYFKAPYY